MREYEKTISPHKNYLRNLDLSYSGISMKKFKPGDRVEIVKVLSKDATWKVGDKGTWKEGDTILNDYDGNFIKKWYKFKGVK